MMTPMHQSSHSSAFLESFSKKHSAQSIISQLAAMEKLKILVIGDAIIDEYHYTTPMGKSSKEPLVVHRYEREESYAGGTLATANHIASVSDNITLVTLLGKSPSYESFIRKHLKPGVKPKFFFRDGSTIVKRRFIDEYTAQKLFQVSFITDTMIDTGLEKTIAAYLKREIPKYDMVLVNDFGHGFLTKNIIHLICRKSPILAINVQANSANYGFNVITKYPRTDFATVDIHEIRLATHDRYSDILQLAKKIFRVLKCKTLIVTRGLHGSTIYMKERGFVDVPAFTDHVIDRMGAGDALFSIISPCLATGMDAETALFIGNIAAAIKIQTVGNKSPIEHKQLVQFITKLLA